MTSVSAGHISLTPIQPVGSGRPVWGSNPRPPDRKLRALSTEIPSYNLYFHRDLQGNTKYKPTVPSARTEHPKEHRKYCSVLLIVCIVPPPFSLASFLSFSLSLYLSFSLPLHVMHVPFYQSIQLHVSI